MIATPNIQVAPNRSTSRAFASLGNLLNVATKVQQAKTAEEAASAQNTEYVDTNNTLVTMASQHTENVLAAGTDLEKLAVANETMTSGLSSLQASISEHTQNRMAGLFRGLQTRADASYQTQAHGIKKDNFNDGLQSVASTFSKQTLEAQQGILEDLKGEATNLGIDKKTFGKDFSSAIYNNQMASMDTEQMALNGDYSQLNTMKATIDHMKILDPKDTESHAAALKKYNTLKNSVDSAVVSSVTAARIAEKVDVFATNGAHAVKNGAMSQEAFNLESARFLKSMTGKVSLGKRKALSLFEGGIPILNEQSAEVATHAKKMFNDSVKAKLLAEGGKDVNWLQEAKTKNPTEYAKIANSFVVNKANALESMMTKGATPEDMMPVLQDMYAAENLTFNTTDVKTLLAMDVMAHYITSGAIDNGAKAMTALRAAGETTMMNGNDDYMIKLSKDLPQGESARAQRMYSALAQSGEMDKGAAYEIVTNRFKSIDIEGVEVSNNVVNFLTSVGAPGTTEGQVGALKEVLTDMFTVTPDKAGAFATLFEGNNPNVRINGNTLIAENGDGAYELLNLDNETLGRLKKGLTDTYTTNNLPDNVDALMSDGADVVASTLNDVIFTGQNNKMVDALQGAGALPVLVVGGISRSMQDRADILLESLDTFYGKVDTFIGDVRSGKRTATQAFNDFRQSNKDVVKAYATAAKAKNSEAYKQYEKETSEAGAVFADSWENLSTHTSNAIKAIGGAIISPAYGSDKPGTQTINPTSSRDRVKALQGTVNKTQDGSIGMKSGKALEAKLGKVEYKKQLMEAYKGRVFASGKYQTIPGTIDMAINAGIIDTNSVYDEAAQEKVADWIIETKQKPIGSFINGNGSIDSAVNALAAEFASFPTTSGNTNKKDGNKVSSTTTVSKVKEILTKSKKAGNYDAIKAYIASKESAADGYNAYNGGTVYLDGKMTIMPAQDKLDITTMTVGEILDTYRT